MEEEREKEEKERDTDKDFKPGDEEEEDEEAGEPGPIKPRRRQVHRGNQLKNPQNQRR